MNNGEASSDVFFSKNIASNKVIKLKRGHKGYWPDEKVCVGDIDELNKSNGHSREDVKAAEICSLSGDWAKFDEIKSKFIKKRA